MTALLPTDPPRDRRPMTARVAEGASRVLARGGRGDRPGRRSFLRRAALVGTALAVNPVDFILRPQSAYASVCGPANECSQGWTAMCCTINGGANTCPPGSYVAGWWKVSSSAFCRGEDRYVVDCNRTPGSRCSCRCADGACDRRRVCCNNFRYGQCNQQVPGVTEVVCRVVICTPPWEYDETCTTTVRTDERTRDHNASCLNGTDPTAIEVLYQDLGLVGSALGARVGTEMAGPDGGSWQRYDDGVITNSPDLGLAVVVGAAGLAYADLGGPDGPLGYVAGDPVEVTSSVTGRTAQVVPAQGGALYATPDRAVAVHGPIHDDYDRRGGATGWLGLPLTGVADAPGGRVRTDFEAGWSLAHDPATGEVRLVPADVELPDQAGQWPPTAGVARWAGDDRVATAVQVSRETRPSGAPAAVVVASGSFADALSGGVLAALLRGPILLTGADALDGRVAEELRRLGVDRVVLVGGPSVLGPQVAEDVRDAVPGADVQRLAGDGRFATAAAVAEAVVDARGDDAAGDTVYLTSGRDFADALAATPAAVGDAAPLLLVEPTSLPDPTADALAELSPAQVVVVGGPAAVADDVLDAVRHLTGATVTRVHGPSRVDTAAAVVARTTPGTAAAVLLATGSAFPDALAAGAAAALVDRPLLLVTEGTTPTVTRSAIARLRPDLLVVVGGSAAVSQVVVDQLSATPTGPTTPRATVPATGGEPEPATSQS